MNLFSFSDVSSDALNGHLENEKREPPGFLFAVCGDCAGAIWLGITFAKRPFLW